MLDEILAWREAFLAFMKEKRYAVAPYILKYAAKTPTTDLEAAEYRLVMAALLQRYESKATTSSGEEGRQVPTASLRGQVLALVGVLEPTILTADLTVVESPAGLPQEGRFGFFKDPLDGANDFGDLDPSDFNGGGSVEGGFSWLELTANPASGGVYSFFRPAENLFYFSIRLSVNGFICQLQRDLYSGGFIGNNPEFVAEVVGAEGTTVPMEIRFQA